MHFSIGVHPAFVTPDNDASMAGCKIRFDADRITYHLIGDYQLMARDEYELPLINHEYTIQEDSFEKDAFIIEGGQAGTVSLVKNEFIDEFIKYVGEKYTAETGLVAAFYVANVGDGSRKLGEC